MAAGDRSTWSFLDGLAPYNISPREARELDRRALVVPVLSGFRPGRPIYEELIAPLRKVRVDVFGLTAPFGPLLEDRIVAHPEMLGFIGYKEEAESEVEGEIRTRSWIDAVADQYGRIVLLSYGPAMGVWSRSVGGSRGARKVQIVPVKKDQGFQGNILKRRLQAALR